MIKGINLGWHTSVGDWTTESSIDFLIANGFNNFRIVANAYDSSFVSWARGAASYAKSQGASVIYGCSASGVTLTASEFTNVYSALVLTEAAYAESIGVEQFTAGNEEELRIDHSTIVDPFALYNTYLKTLATQIKGVFSGLVDACISNGAEPWVQSVTPGNLDRIGFNVYGDSGTRASFQSRIENFKAYANWGSRLYVSEYNTHYNSSSWTSQSANPEAMTIELAHRNEILEANNLIAAYHFCWRYSNSLNYFSLLQNDGTLGLWWNVIKPGNKRWFLTL